MASKLDAFRKKQSSLEERMAAVQDNLMVEPAEESSAEEKQDAKEPVDEVSVAVVKPTVKKEKKDTSSKKESIQESEKEPVQEIVVLPEPEEKTETKPKALMLTHLNTRNMRMTSKRNHISISLYVENLVRTELAGVDIDSVGDEYLINLYESCKGKYEDTKERTTAYIALDAVTRAEKLCDMAGIPFSGYINYLIDKSNR